jgi:hypothetical protein
MDVLISSVSMLADYDDIDESKVQQTLRGVQA